MCTKSHDQRMFQRGNQAAHRRRVRLSKTSMVKFCESKILIPVANGSIGSMKVTTFLIFQLSRGCIIQ